MSDKDEDEVSTTDVPEAPQNPGDPGYEAPAIIPELDGKGGTVFRVGEDTYDTMEEAQAAIAPEEDADDDEPAAKSKRGDAD